jgi:hypothetical protein
VIQTASSVLAPFFHHLKTINICPKKKRSGASKMIHNQLRNQVLSAYRNLLKSRLIVFRGDNRMLDNSLNEIRNQFRSNKYIRDEKEIERMVKDANDAALFLRSSIIQGVKRVDEQEYHLSLSEEQVKMNIDKTVNINPIDRDFVEREERRIRKKQSTTSQQSQPNSNSK